jgi:hypothetical protein
MTMTLPAAPSPPPGLSARVSPTRRTRRLRRHPGRTEPSRPAALRLRCICAPFRDLHITNLKRR